IPQAESSEPQAGVPSPPPSLPPLPAPTTQPVAQNEGAQTSTATAIGAGNSTPAPTQQADATVPQEEAQSANDPNATFSQANPDLRVSFRIKYVAQGVAYLEGGRNDGLTEGMKLEVKAIDPSEKATAKASVEAQPVAELEVASAALSSAVGEIHNPTR